MKTYRWIKASDKPVPKGYTGELRIYGNTDRKCGYTSYQIEEGYAGTYCNVGMKDPDAYWLEEISSLPIVSAEEILKDWLKTKHPVVAKLRQQSGFSKDEVIEILQFTLNK